jgi:CheY-like chemotaxis protein
MTDEFVSLKVMVVSETAADRELIRRSVGGASLPVIISEVATAGDGRAALKSLASDTFDVVLFDEGLPASDKQTLMAAIRGEASQPLAVVIGAAQGPQALDVDGALPKPLEQQRVSELIGECIAARLPKRVLIVDDSAAVRQVIQKVLKASRFRITAEEADGHAAARKQRDATGLRRGDPRLPHVRQGWLRHARSAFADPTGRENPDDHRAAGPHVCRPRPPGRRCRISLQAVFRA